MGIVLILTSSVGLLGFRYIAKARVVAARTTVESLSMAIDSYYLDCRQYPSIEQGFAALWEKPVLAPLPEGWRGPYVSKPVASDPWGNPYAYLLPGPSGLPFGVVSYGADGILGGELDDTDVASWRS